MQGNECSSLRCDVLDPDSGEPIDSGTVEYSTIDGFRAVRFDDGELVDVPGEFVRYDIDRDLYTYSALGG